MQQQQQTSAQYAFVSEPLQAVAGTGDAGAMARGEPGLPVGFVWRGREYRIEAVARAWKSTGMDRGEVYLRRHWWELIMATGERMVVYCERQARDRKHPGRRWWLYEIGVKPGDVKT